MRRALARAVVGLTVVLAIACGRHQEQHGTPVQPVPLPDISRAAPDVQARLREQHAAMSRVVGQASASAADRATAYGDMGKLFIATELYDPAERCFSNAQVLAPGDMRWPYYLAHVARLGNDPVKAAGRFEQALALQPDHVPSLVWLAELRLGQSRPADAKPLLLKAQSLAPAEPAVLYGLGRVALEARDYAAAVKDLEGALALMPSATRVHYPLAMAYRGLGDLTQADAHLRLRGETAVPPADPLMGAVRGLLTNAAALETRGVQAMDARNWPAAVAALRQAVEASPDNAFTRLNLGTSLYLSGDRDAALEQYRAAVRLSPSLARAHFGIGVVLESRRQDRDAIDAFAAAVRSDPAYDEARFSLANALRRSGRVAESLAEYEAVLQRNPGTSQASFGYAMALVRLGRYREARDRLDRDARVFADQPGFAHALARVLAAAPDDRVRDGARALALVKPLADAQRSPAVAETMAMALAETGRFDEAVRWQSEALEMARRGGRPDAVPHLTANLRLYESRRPCRTPWTDDDPVHHPQASPD
ncbi:MAG TPA: tetratricopeptide repeat protein [Vicinamibacterales bacterium]|nr:tetratricopeptide repeat protein [Vicinamibacterales bacterium]